MISELRIHLEKFLDVFIAVVKNLLLRKSLLRVQWGTQNHTKRLFRETNVSKRHMFFLVFPEFVDSFNTNIRYVLSVSPCQIERCTNLLTGKKRKKYLSNFNLTLMIRTVWSKGHFFRTERNISNKKSRFCHRVCGFPLEIECRNARNRTQLDKYRLKSH